VHADLWLIQLISPRRIMVVLESVVSGHQYNAFRERLAEKLEIIRFDPYIQQESLYRERKKIRSA
ncbi:hypothetical protein KR009_010606, partial [Drosophila setifemur]